MRVGLPNRAVEQTQAARIRSQLLRIACSWVIDNGARGLESEVSIAARPLFKAMGFRVERGQVVERRGVELRNFYMIRNADAEQACTGTPTAGFAAVVRPVMGGVNCHESNFAVGSACQRPPAGGSERW